jgi:hypothetical protein
VGGVPGPSSIARVDGSGHVSAWVTLPWKDLEKAPHLRVQAWLASDRHGTCAIAMVFGRGFAIYDGTRFGTPSEYVEWFDMPGAVITQKTSPGVITTSAHLENRRIAARDAAVLPNEVWIPFQGTSEHAGRVIDRYDRKTGHYLHSTVINERIESATANDTHLFVTTTENGYPKLAAYDISKP